MKGRVRVYRTAMWRMSHARPFSFFSLTYPDRSFATEDELFELAARDPRTLERGHASRFAYPLDFIGPLPTLVHLLLRDHRPRWSSARRAMLWRDIIETGRGRRIRDAMWWQHIHFQLWSCIELPVLGLMIHPTRLVAAR